MTGESARQMHSVSNNRANINYIQISILVRRSVYLLNGTLFALFSRLVDNCVFKTVLVKSLNPVKYCREASSGTFLRQNQAYYVWMCIMLLQNLGYS